MNPSVQLLETMLNIRAAEEKIAEVYARDMAMQTPTHLSVGQEAVAAGLCHALQSNDQIFTSHRCHAVYLAKGGAYRPFFAELCGRANGINGGRAGSAHLTDVERGVFSSPILGAMIPVAVGAALSFKMDRSPVIPAKVGIQQNSDWAPASAGVTNTRIAVALFGDAAVEEGVFAESVNFAVTKECPVLFVCENNLYSTHSPLSVRQPKSAIFERVRTPNLKTYQIDGNDVVAVYETFSKVIAEIRATQKPVFIECLTYRIREHVGPLYDYDRGYRSKEEVDAWKAKCPVARLSKKLVDEKIMTAAQIEERYHHWLQLAEAAYNQALQSPWPDPLTILEKVY